MSQSPLEEISITSPICKLPFNMDFTVLETVFAQPNAPPPRSPSQDIKFKTIIEDIAKLRVGQRELAADQGNQNLYRELMGVQGRLLDSCVRPQNMHITCQVAVLVFKAVCETEERMLEQITVHSPACLTVLSGPGANIPGFRAIVSKIAMLRIVERKHWAEPRESVWSNHTATLRQQFAVMYANFNAQPAVVRYILDLFRAVVAQEDKLQSCYDHLLSYESDSDDDDGYYD